MKKVPLDIDEQVFIDISVALGIRRDELSAAQVTREAFMLFKWAIRKRKAGLTIVAATEAGPLEAVTTTLLDQIKVEPKLYSREWLDKQPAKDDIAARGNQLQEAR